MKFEFICHLSGAGVHERWPNSLEQSPVLGAHLEKRPFVIFAAPVYGGFVEITPPAMWHLAQTFKCYSIHALSTQISVRAVVVRVFPS